MDDITPTQQMLASCSGALVTSLFVTPLDVVKTRLQSQTAPVNKCFLYCNGLMDHLCVCVNGNGKEKWYRRPGQFSGTVDAFIKISRHEGVTSLWSGLSPTLIMAIPATVLYFTSYDQLKSKMQHKYGGNSILIPAIAGSISRTGTVTVITPLELIRTKMQSQSFTYQEIGKVVQQSVRKSGIRSLWTGWAPMIMRDVPFSVFYWFTYELIKSNLSDGSSFINSFCGGFAAGTIATILTHPMDLTKTRRQILLGDKALDRAASAELTSISILKDVVSQRGISGIFTGLLPRIAKIGPACAIMISSYEFGKRFFKQYNNSVNNTGFADSEINTNIQNRSLIDSSALAKLQ